VTASSGLLSRPAMPDDWLGEKCLRRLRKAFAIGELGRTFVARVRLFEAEELVTQCTAAGFEVDVVLGDYAGGALIADSPRPFLFARRQ
jgi:hypothetical protein